MNFSWYTRVLLAVASGVALALAFPSYNLPLFGWIAIGLLALASFGARPRIAWIYGLINAMVFYPMSVPWIDVVMRQYGDVGPLTAAGILGLLAFTAGVLTAIFSWGVAFASRRSMLFTCLLAPCLWVATEFARSNLPIIEFPWNLIGYAASGNLAFAQLTALTGIFGLSFVVAGFGALLAYAVLVGTQRAWKLVLVVTAVLVVVALGGPRLVPSAAPRYMAHLVQTNFAQSYDYPPDWMRTHAAELDELDQISIDAAKRIPGVIIWPEVPAPFTYNDPGFASRARTIARDSRQDLLVGIVDWKRDAAGKWFATNSSTLVDPAGQRVFTYDKIHLVPFGEYVPLRRWLTFAGKLTADIGDFTPGSVYRIGNLPGGKFGVYICYEGVIPRVARRFTADGAQLLINVSNDGWFGDSAAPIQDLRMSTVRAVENHRWLLRDTNNGYTVSVDPYGRIVAELAPDIRGQLDAPYDFRTGLTPYARFGNWFARLCVLASLILLGASIKKKKIAT